MDDAEKIARLQVALQEPEGKYTHDQIRAKLAELQGPRPSLSGHHDTNPSDVDLGIESGPMKADPNNWMDRFAGTGEQLPGGKNEKAMYPRPRRPQTELEGDPGAQMMLAGAEGSVAAAPIAGGVSLLAPSVAPVVGNAVAGGIAAKAQGASTKEAGRASVISALMGVPSMAKRLLTQAPAATEARLQSSIDPGRGVSAKRVDSALPVARQEIEETPGLKKTLVTSSDPAVKADAVGARMDTLNELNDADWDKIGEFYGNEIPVRTPQSRIAALRAEAEANGDEPLMKAAGSVSDQIERFASPNGGITAKKLRGIRSGLAEHLSTINPGDENGVVGEINKRNAIAVKAAINDAVGRLARQVPGLDADALAQRTQRTAAMIPVQDSLETQARNARLGTTPGADELNPKKAAMRMGARVFKEAPAKADFALTHPTVQAVGAAIPVSPPSAAMGPVDPLIRALRGRNKQQETENAN